MNKLFSLLIVLSFVSCYPNEIKYSCDEWPWPCAPICLVVRTKELIKMVECSEGWRIALENIRGRKIPNSSITALIMQDIATKALEN